MSAILLCTVGGSHQPVLTSIEENGPGYVCFFCTGRDPETGKQGSIDQVTGKGSVIKANRDDDKPTLPNIAVQAGLTDGGFQTTKVPADDLDGACAAMRACVADLAERFPGARFVADYTGGTKTMTAALVCTALERDDVALQLVSGARSDLVAVRPGTERAMAASVDRLRLDRAMKPYLGAWRRYAYREAAAGLAAIRIAANAPDRARLGLGLALSRALAHWDDFDHAGALALLEVYAGRFSKDLLKRLPDLRLLAGDRPHSVPARLWDLWLNAERRAAQGRFDDAVARWYRLMEWTAQWQLKVGCGADTADFPRELLPPEVDVKPDRDGKIKVGLRHAWRIAACHLAGPIKTFYAANESMLFDLLELRNESILAHGFRPVRRADWDRVRDWTLQRYLPLLQDLGKRSGLRSPLRQLPTEPPAAVRDVI